MRWRAVFYAGPSTDWDVQVLLVNVHNAPMAALGTGDHGWRTFPNLREAVEYVRREHLGSVEWDLTFPPPLTGRI